MKYLIPFLLVIATFCSQPKEKSEALTFITPPHAAANLPYLTSYKGVLYHSWLESAGDSVLFQLASYQNNSWSDPELISSGTNWFLNWADYPMIAVTEKGKMAHSLKKSSPETFSYDVMLTTSPSPTEWSKEFKAHNDTTLTEHGFITMLPLTDSTFQIAWLDGRNTGGDSHENHEHGGGAMTLRTAIIGLDGNITEEMELDNRTCDCCQTGGAVTSNGPIFIYRNRTELEIRDIYITRKVDNEWTSPKPIASDNWNIAGCPVNGPRADAIDNALGVAWFTAANGQPTVKAVFSNDAGENFGEPITLDKGLPLGRVDLVMLDQQSAMVSWLTQENEKTLIKVQKVYSNGVTEPPTVISETSNARGSGFPQMARVGNEVFFAWTILEKDGTTVKMAKMRL